MLIVKQWPDWFEVALTDWLTVKGAPKPNCPDCSARMADVSAPIGRRTYVLFQCGHQFHSIAPGLTKREIR